MKLPRFSQWVLRDPTDAEVNNLLSVVIDDEKPDELRRKAIMLLSAKRLLPAELSPIAERLNPTVVVPDRPAGNAHGKAAKPDVKRRALMVCLEDVEAEEYEWLWPGRIPLRTVSLIAGDGGVGKSTLTGSLATIVTTGSQWPDLPGEPVQDGQVVFLTAEENAATDIRPRLNYFGADCSRVHILKSIMAGEGDDATELRFSLTRDIPVLADAVEQLGNVRLVVIDPVGSYLSGSDSHNDAEVQQALNPLFQLAEDHRLAVVLVAHLTKQSSADIQSRIQGAAAFVNKSRMVWYYSADPRNHSHRLLSFIKGNPVGKETRGLSASFVDGVLAWSPDPVEMTAKQAAFRLAQQAARGELDGKRGPRAEQTKEAAEFIRGRLQLGPINRAELVSDAKDELSVSRGAVYKAIKKLNGHVQEFKGADGGTWLKWEPHLPLEDASREGSE